MSDCCLPNLGCLSIPVISTNVAGNPGQNGAPGAAATIAVGTVTTVNPGDPATVTNSGTTSAAIFDFEIPEGAPGAAGVNGVARLYSNTLEQFSSLLNQFVPTYQYTIPVNTLVNNGDSLVINLRSVRLTTNTNVAQRRINFNATSCTLYTPTGVGLTATEPFMITNNSEGLQYNTRVEIIKISATQARCLVVADIALDVNLIPIQQLTYQNTLTGLDFTITNTISADLWQSASGQSRLKSITIGKIKAL